MHIWKVMEAKVLCKGRHCIQDSVQKLLFVHRRALKKSHPHPAIAISCGKIRLYNSSPAVMFNLAGTRCVSTVGSPALDHCSDIRMVSEADWHMMKFRHKELEILLRTAVVSCEPSLCFFPCCVQAGWAKQWDTHTYCLLGESVEGAGEYESPVCFCKWH